MSGDKSIAPAPGQPSSRTPETERNYLRRALWFEAHTGRCLSIESPSSLEVAAYALERREEWSKSTWRQIKAALVFRFSTLGAIEAREAANMLLGGSQSPCVTKTGRTSARRSKAVSDQSLKAVLGRIHASKSKYASMLETWLLLGAEIGLRPHEWGQATLIYLTPMEVGDVHADVLVGAFGDVAKAPYLRIRNSKTTNGRSHGEFRHLNLSRIKPSLIEMIGEFAELMTEVVESGHYQTYYAACRKLLWRINKSLHGKHPRKWLQLYSPRHKFSSEAKNALGAEGVAAMMGHATTKTASEHYGRRTSATGGLGPRPIESEIIRVRKIRNYKARNAASAPIPAVTVDTAC